MDKIAGGYITKIETFSTYMASTSFFFLLNRKPIWQTVTWKSTTPSATMTA